MPPPQADTLAGTLAIVLAAGKSSRTGAQHKLLAPDASGCPMLVQTLRHTLHSAAAHVRVLLPPDRPDLAALVHAMPDYGARLSSQSVADAAMGLSASLHAGVRLARSMRATSLLVCLGDMPLVPTHLLDALLYEQHTTQAPVVAAQRDGRPGNPVVWSPTLFEALLEVTGDQGGRALLRTLGPAVRLLPASAALLEDFDTPDRLAQFARMLPPPG
ncbi:nucleotidyltransferase family protein [Acetobacter okinawensis]|uniref:nucleotidyltransferase family protein n=1 Tax=Acetobacter okinawensis TaxID=1076594 RepID=UPI0039EC3459